MNPPRVTVFAGSASGVDPRALAAGGEVIGVVPRFLADLGTPHPDTEIRLVDTLAERTGLMADLAAALDALA